MSLPRVSPYAGLSGALWGDIVSADTMVACALIALDRGFPEHARDYLLRAQAAAARGIARNVAQYDQAEQAA